MGAIYPITYPFILLLSGLVLIERYWLKSYYALVILLCWLFSTGHILYIVSKQFPSSLEQATLQATFEVITAPVQKANGISFKAKPINISCISQSTRWPQTEVLYNQACHKIKIWSNPITLTHYYPRNQISAKNVLQKNYTFNIGSVLQANIRLRQPRGLVNRGLFDYQAWLLANKIYAKGYILPASLTVLSTTNSTGFLDIFSKIRRDIYQDLSQTPNVVHQALFKALLIGDKTDVTAHQWEVLSKTGTLHLMAISGLHIGLAALMGFVVMRQLITLSLLSFYRLTGRFSFSNYLRLLPYLASIITAFIYAGLAGFSLPTLRALVMVCTANICFLIWRRVHPFSILGLAAFIILLFDPFAFLASGFWLSFGAVILLVLIYRPVELSNQKVSGYVVVQGVSIIFTRVRHYLGVLLSAQWVLFWGLLFPVLFLTSSINWVAPIANAILVPLVSLFIVPLLFLYALSLFAGSFIHGLVSAPLLKVNDAFMQWGWGVLEWLFKWQSNTLSVDVNTHLSLCLIILGGLCCVAFIVLKPLVLRLLCGGLLGILIFSPSKNTPYFELSVLDVGQGLAVVITHNNYTLQYDSGAFLSPTFDMGKNIIAPTIKSKNHKKINTLVISHSDNDHIGGAQSLINAVSVDNVIISKADAHNSFKALKPHLGKTRPITFSECEKGMTITHSHMQIDVLWPVMNGSQNTQNKNSNVFGDKNNRSCVLLVTVKPLNGGSFDKSVNQKRASDQNLLVLLTGDISKAVEAHLIDLGLPKVDILIAPHHGSKTSSSSAFIQALSPDAVIFSAGYKNKYGHPHSDVIENYTKNDVKIFNTASDGEVYLLYDGHKPYHVDQITAARQRKSRPLWIK